MKGVNQQPKILQQPETYSYHTSPKSFQTQVQPSLSKIQSLSPASRTNYLIEQGAKSLNSGNSVIKKQKYEKLTKLYQANRLKLQEYNKRQRFLEQKKIEQFEITQKITKYKLENQKNYNQYQQQIQSIRQRHIRQNQKQESLIEELTLELKQCRQKFRQKDIKKQFFNSNQIKLDENQQQNSSSQTFETQNQRLHLELNQIKQHLTYLQDKIWLQNQRAKQFYPEQMLNQEIFNIQYKLQAMKITNLATTNYYIQIKSETQQIQNADYTEVQYNSKLLRTQCQQLMEIKNSILPDIKKYKEKRKKFKQLYQIQKEKISQSKQYLKEKIQKLEGEKQKCEKCITSLKQIQQIKQKQRGQPEQLVLLRYNNTKVRQQIKSIRLSYEKIKGSTQNLAPKVLATECQKKIKNLKLNNEKISNLIAENQTLNLQNQKLSKIKEQLQWKNNPHQQNLEKQKKKIESQNQILEKQVKDLKKNSNNLQSKLILLEQKQKEQEQKRIQQKLKLDQIQKKKQIKRREAQEALKRLIQKLSIQRDEKPTSRIKLSSQIIESKVSNPLTNSRKVSKSKKGPVNKQERTGQMKDHFSHSLKQEVISSSTESSQKTGHDIQFGQSSEPNTHQQQEQLKPFIRSHPYWTYIIFLVMFFFIPGGWLMKFG